MLRADLRVLPYFAIYYLTGNEDSPYGTVGVVNSQLNGDDLYIAKLRPLNKQVHIPVQTERPNV